MALVPHLHTEDGRVVARLADGPPLATTSLADLPDLTTVRRGPFWLHIAASSHIIQVAHGDPEGRRGAAPIDPALSWA